MILFENFGMFVKRGYRSIYYRSIGYEQSQEERLYKDKSIYDIFDSLRLM